MTKPRIKQINAIDLDQRLRPVLRDVASRFTTKFEPTLDRLKGEVYDAYYLGFESGRFHERTQNPNTKGPHLVLYR